MSGRDVPWWDLDDALTTFISTARELRDRDETRRIAYRVWDDLYEGRSLYSMENAAALDVIGRVSSLNSRSLNFARNAVDFVHSKCSAETPTVRAAGHGADWNQHIRARGLSKFIQGASDALDMDTRMPSSLLVAMKNGTGCVKVDRRSGRITLDIVSPREFFVDADDARYGNPRVLYQVRAVDRRALAAEHPDHRDAILGAPVTTDSAVGVYDAWDANATPDATDVYEAWVLPIDAGDVDDPESGESLPLGRGRHIKVVEGQVLIDEDWEVERFPVAFLRLSDPRPGGGFWGCGLLERLDANQCEIDDLVSHIGESIRENNPKVFLDDRADIVPEHVADPTVGTIIRYNGTGNPPTFMTPESVSSQEIEWLQQRVQWLYADAGMSEASAQGEQQSKLTSGRAILFQHDMQTQRYVDYTKRYGRHVVDVIDRVIDAAKMLGEDDPDWTVRYSTNSVARQIRWSEVDMDRDAFVIELEEVSPVPDSFAGRIQQIEQDAAEGRIPPEYLVDLRQDPDRWRFAMRSSQADTDFIDDVIDRLHHPDKEMPRVIDEMNKPLALSALRSEILNAIVADADPEVVSRLQYYAAAVVDSMQPATVPAPQPVPQMIPPGVGPAGDGGQGGAPPVPPV